MKVHNCHLYAECLGQSHAGPLVASSVSVSFYEASCLCGFCCDILDCSCSYNSSFLSSVGFPELSPIFGCRSLLLFPLTIDEDYVVTIRAVTNLTIGDNSSGYISTIARVILVDSWEFPFHRVSSWPQNVPLASHLFQGCAEPLVFLERG